MEIEVLEKQKRCDFCTTQSEAYHKCLGCGKDVCWKCKEQEGYEYEHSVTCSCASDGWYCKPCNVILAQAEDPLFEAYYTIRVLREEWKEFYDEFRFRSKCAEKLLEDLLRKRVASDVLAERKEQ